jgi:hypothetical protein
MSQSLFSVPFSVMAEALLRLFGCTPQWNMHGEGNFWLPANFVVASVLFLFAP